MMNNLLVGRKIALENGYAGGRLNKCCPHKKDTSKYLQANIPMDITDAKNICYKINLYLIFYWACAIMDFR